MFYELMMSMMRKKEQIMYATIKGTLTENDGVFSGFSVSNYLQIQDTFNLQDIKEIVVKINLPSSALNKSKYEFILVKGNFRISCYSYATYFGASGVDVAGVGNIAFGINFQPDTDYWLKYKNDGVNCSCAYSTDGTTWVAGGSKSASTISSSTSITYLGLRNDTSVYFDGSIDLNNSYIKLGATKYNLQAVVGYTIVGSPTITDGVVSGFSSSDYLRIPRYNDIESANFEMCIKYSNISVTGHRIFQFGTISTNACQLRTLSTGAIFYDTSTKRYTTNKTIDDYNYVKLKTTNGLENNVEIFVSADGVFWEKTTLTETTNTLTFSNNVIVLGRGIDNNATIDLNKTYIKINNKLWFNGQQA